MFILLLFLGEPLELIPQSQGFTSYSVSDGLAQSNVIDIEEDHFGNLWLATEGGLCKFNGVEFTTYKMKDGLSSNQVRCISVLEHQVWLGTEAGISCFNGNSFQNYPLNLLGRDQWVNNIFADSAGNIWFSTTSGNIGYISTRGDSVTIKHLDHTVNGKVSGIAEGRQEIWIATYKDGIYKYSNDSLDRLNLNEGLMQAKVTTIYVDDSQRVWLGTNKGLYVQANDSFDFVHSFHADPEDFAIYSISMEEKGAVWVGTTNGAFRYSDGVCTPVNASDGLTDNIIYKIHRDREGTLWFGSFGGGIYKSMGELFTKIGKEHGVSYDYISSISQDIDGNYWFGSYGGGAYRVTMPISPEGSMVVRNYHHDQGLSNNFIYSLAPDGNTMWMGTASGLNRLQNGSISSYYKEHGLPSNHIYSLIKCQDGSIYCGTTNGLSQVIERPTIQFKNFTYQGEKKHNKIRTLIETSEGELLMATAGGLKFFDGKSIQDYFEADSLKHQPTTTVYQDQQGALWCAMMDNGVLYYDPKSKSSRVITEQQGLSSDIIYTLVVDQQGCLWVGTPHGLDKISFDTEKNIESIRHFGAQEGFFGVETNTNAILQQPDGSIWFGTVEGAYKCRPELDQVNLLEPITRITGVRLFSQAIDWNSAGALSHNQNNLTFEFFGNSLKNPDKVRYKYKLENFDRTWQPITKTNEAVYTNLPPGEYTFQVKASNNDGVWNQIPATVNFEITPPFWRTWWFFLLMVVVLGVTGRLYYKSRVQSKLDDLMRVEKIKNQETTKVRQQVAEDFHDQVGNQLASITVLVQLIQAKLSSGNQEVEEMLNKLGQFTKALFTGTRDFIWSIDPKSDKLNEMLIYIRDFGEELFEYSDINFHVETNDAFTANAKLPVGWSRHIVFIFKEALTNSFRHANCKNVYLNFNVSDNNYVFELRDDGKGLNGYNENDIEGTGLRNMKERAQKIGGKIVISCCQEWGTRIELAGKIPQNEG